MKLFRRIWLLVTIAVALVFAGYLVFQSLKEYDSGPVFSCDETPIELSVQDDLSVLLQGVTAFDEEDGDVTGSVLVEKISKIYDGNRRSVTYAAFDKSGNVAKTTRELHYTDYVPPRFSLTHSLRYRTGEIVDLAQTVHAQDCLDGDISSKVSIRVDSTVSSKTAGVYQVQFSVTNSAGDTQTLATQLEVYDAQINEAVLTASEYLIYWDNQEPDYRSYLQSIALGGKKYVFEPGNSKATAADGSEIKRSSVQVHSSVDASTPGVYPVYLTYQDDDYQGTAQLLVVVK